MALIGQDTADQRIAQALMIAFVMITCDVLGHDVLEVPLAERNDSIQTLMFDGPYKALSMGIRIRRPPRRLYDAAAAIAQQPAYRLAIDDPVRELSEQELPGGELRLTQISYFRIGSDEVDCTSNCVEEPGTQARPLMFVPPHGLS